MLLILRFAPDDSAIDFFAQWAVFADGKLSFGPLYSDCAVINPMHLGNRRDICTVSLAVIAALADNLTILK